jgi:hypothetical protein
MLQLKSPSRQPQQQGKRSASVHINPTTWLMQQSPQHNTQDEPVLRKSGGRQGGHKRQQHGTCMVRKLNPGTRSAWR